MQKPAGEVVQRRQEALRRAMSKRGLRNTRQRELVAGLFFASNEHLSIEELLRLARDRDDGIGYATIYRTLKLLAELGLAHERRFTDGQTRYEPADGVHHDHLICNGCGRIEEFENERIEHLQEQVAKQRGFRLISHRMELYGLCPSCQVAEDEVAS